MIGCDLIVAAGDEAVSTLRAGRSHAVVCTDLIATAEFARNADWKADAGGLLERIACTHSATRLTVVDGQRLAVALMGDAIAANMLMLGVAWQQGWIPLSRAAIERAIELNGVAVDMNRQGLPLGPLHRARTADRGRADASRAAQVIQFASAAEPADARRDRRAARGLAHRLPGRRARAALHGAGRRSAARGHGARRPAGRWPRAVARYYFKLLAVKDEWEVARLYTGRGFREELEQTFEGDYELHFHLGAWPFAQTRPRHRQAGQARGRPVADAARSAVLARLRFLRGSAARSLPQQRRSGSWIAPCSPSYEGDVRMLVAGLIAAELRRARWRSRRCR